MTGAPHAGDEPRDLARLYDLDLVEDPGDLDLYLAVAGRTNGPILELGVGTGRLAVPLAAAGYRVVGVDRDGAMLERARLALAAAGDDARGRLDLVEADFVGLRLPSAGTFGLVFLALNSLLLVPTRDAQRETLRTIAAHLAPGGVAVVDAWLPDADDLARFAAIAVVSAWSYGGLTSTTSMPARSTAATTWRTARRTSRVSIPPGSGVPVPGAIPGSMTSMSRLR